MDKAYRLLEKFYQISIACRQGFVEELHTIRTTVHWIFVIKRLDTFESSSGNRMESRLKDCESLQHSARSRVWLSGHAKVVSLHHIPLAARGTWIMAKGMPSTLSPPQTD